MLLLLNGNWNATGSRSKKLVPVLVTYCETPNILRHVTMCDYTRGDLTGWFWDRLIKSLQAPLNPHEITVDNPSSLSGLEMSVDCQRDSFSSSFSSSSVSSQPQRQAGGSGHSGPSSLPVTIPARLSSSPSLSVSSSPGADRRTGTRVKGAHTVAGPVSQPTKDTSSRLSSPSTDRKPGTKKKGLRSKLTSVFSSHSSWACGDERQLLQLAPVWNILTAIMQRVGAAGIYSVL